MTDWTKSVSPPSAESDIVEIENYYRSWAPEQIDSFDREFDRLVADILKWPFLTREDAPGIRHRAMEQFPYFVFYEPDENRHHITILAVVHELHETALKRIRGNRP